MRSNPTSPLALMLLGAGLVRLERPSEAIPFLRRAVVLADDASYPRFYLVLAYRALGDTVAAGEEAERLRQLNPALAQQLSADAAAPMPRTP
jgi:hypothetical protein